MTFAFVGLRVYQKSVDFADAVCTSTEQFQCGYGFQVNQLNRAALSISSNFDIQHALHCKRVQLVSCHPDWCLEACVNDSDEAMALSRSIYLPKPTRKAPRQ